jgi:hypothetical protein
MRTLGALTLCLLTALALPAQGAQEAELDELLELSGFARQIDHVPAGIEAGISQQLGALGQSAPDLVDALFSAIDAAFDHDAILLRAREALAARLDEDMIETLLAWYRSPAARRITEGEVEGSDPGFATAMIEVAPELLVDAERVARAQQFNSIIDPVDALVAENRRSVIATFLLLQASTPGAGDVDLEELEAILDAQEPTLRLQLIQSMLVTTLFMHRAVPLDDLDAYLDFARTPAYAVFAGILMDSMTRAQQRMVDALLGELGARMTDARRRPESA